MRLRTALYRHDWLTRLPSPAPLLVVGNLTVGGTGKTPLVAEIVRRLQARGRRPGVIARGYGGRSRSWPRDVDADSDPQEVGDEPVLLAARLGVPVVVGPDRVTAARRAVHGHGCDVLVGDDGLQHLRLRRQAELLVVDGRRGFGNGRCLPSGPLREPRARAREVDALLYSGGERTPGFELRPVAFVAVAPDAGSVALAPDAFAGQAVQALAGIGHPRQFFDTLRALGCEVEGHAFADHHRFRATDLRGLDRGPLLMTEKDAVKCRRLALPPLTYALRVEARPDAAAETILETLLDGLLKAPDSP